MTKQALLLLVALALLSPAAGAGEDRDHDRIRRAVLSGEILPLSAILDRVNTEYAGELIEAELEGKHGRPVYEIKLVTPEGKLLKLHYDARDGRKLSVREKSP